MDKEDYMTETIVFNHRVGDGIHYITDNPKKFEDGTEQLGDTSEVCIILNIETLLSRHNIEYSFNDFWNFVYPEDFMSEADMAYIVYTAIDFTEPFETDSPDDISLAIEDVRAMGCPEVAGFVETLFIDLGLLVP